MNIALLWLYILNVSLLIVHEMESVHWQEWEEFNIRGGLRGFLLMHIPLYVIVLWGLVEASKTSPIGLLISMIISIAGILAFTNQSHSLAKDKEKFHARLSRYVLLGVLVISVLQLAVTVLILLTSMPK